VTAAGVTPPNAATWSDASSSGLSPATTIPRAETSDTFQGVRIRSFAFSRVCAHFKAVRIVLNFPIFLSATPCAFPPPQPSNFSNYSFWSTTLLTGMTGIFLHMQWPLTSQLHGSVSQREQLVFC
jgi:hypothetical protein